MNPSPRSLVLYLILPLIFPFLILFPLSVPLLFLALPLQNIIPLSNLQTSRVRTFFLSPYETLSKLSIKLITHAWTLFFLYPAYFALVGFGWAMQPFEPDAVDLYLSLGPE